MCPPLPDRFQQEEGLQKRQGEETRLQGGLRAAGEWASAESQVLGVTYHNCDLGVGDVFVQRPLPGAQGGPERQDLKARGGRWAESALRPNPQQSPRRAQSAFSPWEETARGILELLWGQPCRALGL